MKKIPFRTGSHNACGPHGEIRYYILVNTIQVPGWADLENYGIGAETAEAGFCGVECVSLSAERVKQMLNTLCDNGVTPAHLRDAVEDML